MTGQVVAIIPARYGSIRLPGKPLIDLCGKPMIQHVVEQTRQAKYVEQIIVATDDDRIANAVRNFGGNAIMTPSELRSGSDRIAYVARTLDSAAIIVNVQGDEPLIDPTMIDEAVSPLLADTTIEVGTLARRIDAQADIHNPGVVKVVVDAQGFALYFSRSPIPFVRDGSSEDYPMLQHIGLYVFRRDFLMQYSSWPESSLEQAEKLEQLRILENGHRIKVALTRLSSIPVDTAEDVETVRRILNQRETSNSTHVS